MITAYKKPSITFHKSTEETSSCGWMRKLSNYYEGEKGPYYGSCTSAEMVGIIAPVKHFESFSGDETSLEFLSLRVVTKPEVSEKIHLKRLEASKRIDERRNKIGPIGITAEELVQEGRRLRQEELTGKDND